MKSSISKITEGIKITVKTDFMENQSSSENGYFLFSYRITIENKSEYAVQLISRHWDIFDSNFDHREVDGEGVVGEQPILAPSETYEYESVCNLNTDVGKMKGYYTLIRQIDQSTFNVIIPEFELVVPYRMN